ncbi:SusC/RagA family TonB-linked outer membrane protein [Mucilaginibacter sp. KACC 22063]|uniref:SusC/RagA family TonB-linked outer membrane protein n=1 Tax=Mucilaginibacter sp. KACC 22063 TaxID=3025666 RepID=UPI0023667C74|nr:SusC/RagA family TonB-linked outer membrane protein [Mucilaginibacter sp. KACC 22063]WDF54418.1 SusC/RagA family TonB-linked outer membrane protein [Mucilaginibacter sp. KACC 22063]
MNKFLRKCLWFLGFISAAANAQNVRITGKVIAREDGSALPGVTVAVRGTSTGTVTNAQGIYSLNVPSKNTTVSFSFIGYIRKDTTAAHGNNLNVTLSPDSKQLQEVVVTTALGIKRKAKELGYATQTVSAKDLTLSKPTNVAQGLSGKVAGLQITQANNQIDAGDQIRVVLRGNRSFVGNNQALLVVDGVTTSLNYLNSLNPNDVESVNVLKGATAAALYGSEASNGVIIVTTKRGNTDGGGSFTFTNTTMLNKLSYFPKLQSTFGGGTNQDAFGFPQFTPYENQNFGDRFDGSTRAIGRPLADGTSQMVVYQNLPDEKKKFFDTGLDVQNDVTYSGGDKNGSLFANVQHLDSKGTTPGDKANRTSIRLNGMRNYKDVLTINFNFDYTQRNYDKSYNQVYNNVINTPAEIPLTQYKDLNSLWGNPNNFYNDYYQSPYFGLQDQRQKERKDQVLGNLSLGYKATSWLDLLVRGGISTTYQYDKYTQAAFTYSDFAKASGKSIAVNDILSSTSANNQYLTRYNGDFLATFHKNVKDFSLRAIAGAQLIDDQKQYMSVGAGTLVIPNFYNVGNVSGIPSAGESMLRYRTFGLFGDLTVGYKDWLFLHGSGRQDKDSRLARGNRQFFYPAVDASFVFTDAIPALKNNHILSSGKLRAGISKVYTVQLDPYQLQSTFGVGGGFPYGNVAGFSVGNTVYDPTLKPEKSIQKEIGLDLGFLDNRITLETSAYTGVTSDQEIKTGINISNTTGFSSAVINTGSGRTSGIEVAIAASPVISLSNGFRWNVSVNYSYNTNKVLSVYQGLDRISIGNFNYIVQGLPYPQLVGSDYARDPQGRVIVSPVTGLPSQANTNVIFGQSNPKNILGLTTSFQFKGFTLAGTAELRSGAYFYNDFAGTLDFSGISYTSAETGRQRFVYPNSVIQTAPGVYVPNTNITTNSGSGDFWANAIRTGINSNYVTSADFIKIRELSLSYDVPARYLRGQKVIKKASIGLVGRNLFMFRPKSNIYTDPEINAQTDNAQGVSNLNQTPPTRLYGFTASIGF